MLPTACWCRHSLGHMEMFVHIFGFISGQFGLLSFFAGGKSVIAGSLSHSAEDIQDLQNSEELVESVLSVVFGSGRRGQKLTARVVAVDIVSELRRALQEEAVPKRSPVLFLKQLRLLKLCLEVMWEPKVDNAAGTICRVKDTLNYCEAAALFSHVQTVSTTVYAESVVSSWHAMKGPESQLPQELAKAVRAAYVAVRECSPDKAAISTQLSKMCDDFSAQGVRERVVNILNDLGLDGTWKEGMKSLPSAVEDCGLQYKVKRDCDGTIVTKPANVGFVSATALKRQTGSSIALGWKACTGFSTSVGREAKSAGRVRKRRSGYALKIDERRNGLVRSEKELVEPERRTGRCVRDSPLPKKSGRSNLRKRVICVEKNSCED